MSLLTSKSPLELWQEAIKSAEDRCSISLEHQLEAYLVTLLARYTDKPHLVKQIIATAFLETQQMRDSHRDSYMREVGDQCLLFAGLFPRIIEKRNVKLSYFVEIGRTAYTSISKTTDDLFGSLSFQFVVLMDVLQSIRSDPDMLPIEAYEQWNEVGSQRALKILRLYSKGTPIKI